MLKLLLNNIKISLDQSEDVAIEKAKKMLSANKINPQKFDFSIFKKSIDAKLLKFLIQ